MEHYSGKAQEINARKRPYWKKRYREKRTLHAIDLSSIESWADTESAYIAGLLDGEGSFNIISHGVGKILNASISVSMTDEPTIAWFAKKVGLSYTKVHRKQKPHHLPIYKVAIAGKRAVFVAEKLLPFLITKKAHAIILSEFGKIGFYHGKQMVDNQLPREEITAMRLNLQQQIRPLNGLHHTSPRLAKLIESLRQQEQEEAAEYLAV